MSEVIQASTAPVAYNGIYIRNNLASTGLEPESPPFNLSPDIIQSGVPIKDPTNTFSTIASWQQSYGTDPNPGANYYYVRGLNSAKTATEGTFRLYWSLAQVLNLPSAWQNNPISTASGSPTVSVDAAPGQIGVGADPFVLRAPSLPNSVSYLNFVAQSDSGSNPIPTVSSWGDLAQLLANPGFGFRNESLVDGAAAQWTERQTLTVPAGFDPVDLSIVVSSQGFKGASVGMLCDSFTPSGQVVSIPPTVIAGDGLNFGTTASVEPGFTTNMGVFFWNDSGAPLQPGSALTIQITAPVSPNSPSFGAALSAGLFSAQRDAAVARATGSQIGPTASLLVGQFTFTVSAPTTTV